MENRPASSTNCTWNFKTWIINSLKHIYEAYTRIWQINEFDATVQKPLMRTSNFTDIFVYGVRISLICITHARLPHILRHTRDWMQSKQSQTRMIAHMSSTTVRQRTRQISCASIRCYWLRLPGTQLSLFFIQRY